MRLQYIFIVGLLLLGLTSQAQRIQDFEYLNDPIDQEIFLSVGISSSHLGNPAAPNAEDHAISAYTMYFDLRHYRLDAGRASFYYSNQLLGDMLLLLQRTIANPANANRAVGSSLSSGLIGWINWGWNLSRAGSVQPFVGLNLNDYFLTSTYEADTIPTSNNWGTYEPQGYYFAAGPMLGVRAALGKIALLEARTTYSLSYLRAASISYAFRDNAYPKPHFVQMQLDLLTKWGFFATLQHHRMLNRGPAPNTTRRWDGTLGFRFMF